MVQNDGNCLNSAKGVCLEEYEEEFRSCCDDEDELKEWIEPEGDDDDDDDDDDEGDCDEDKESEISEIDLDEHLEFEEDEETESEISDLDLHEHCEELEENRESEKLAVEGDDDELERELKEPQESKKLITEGDVDEAEEEEEMESDCSDIILDEHSVKLCFKGISMSFPEDSDSGISGIGVVMERSGDSPPMEVQKKLDFFVEQTVADYLALIDGLVEAAQNKIRRVYALTDSKMLYNQIMHEKGIECPLLEALRQRLFEYTNNLELFVLKLAPTTSLARASELARVAIGIVSPSLSLDDSTESCSICCEEKLAVMMMKLKCSHKFCSNCMKTYVEGKVDFAQVPIRCPQLRCNYCISSAECKSFLPVVSYESLERALEEADALNVDKIYCPYPNCSVLLDPHKCFSMRASSSSQPDNTCVECTVCQRFICIDCRVPWHSSMTCDEYQRETGYVTMHRLGQNKRPRHCLNCQRTTELTHGCYHVTCRCEREFWDDEIVTQPTQQFEHWAWDSFESLPMIMDAYSDQERSQLELIQRFLAGGFSLTDHQPLQSPPRCTDSYVDAMKDLHQLPWLERFVSVISDNYYEDVYQ